ncbi:hypothetical protein Pyrfu_1183 [Pyrolobus fumarii 1A]|uniref:Uncharacterized protein n=1 Tax=Pyrolobus fumarii (strain DSM 11204 / 1A) TaxID=694429 RepID=G0EFU5_PYRF1|nr:hypothetical protein Pyrfu_1183 [Pyrolobus fumarii 1A]
MRVRFVVLREEDMYVAKEVVTGLRVRVGPLRRLSGISGRR